MIHSPTLLVWIPPHDCDSKSVSPSCVILASEELSFQRTPFALFAEHFRESVHSGLGHNPFLWSRAATDADRADNFSVWGCQRQSPFHQNGSGHRQYSVTSASNGVFESLGRTLEG